MKSVLWYRHQSATNVILTELQTPSSFKTHVFISEKAKDEQSSKAKTGSNVETIHTLVGFAEKARANTRATGNLEQVPITRTSLPRKTTIIIMKTWIANACQAHNDPVDSRKDDGEKALDSFDDEENDTFSSYTHIWYKRVHKLFLSFRKDKGKGKGKGTDRNPVRPSHLSLEDRRRRLKELRAKTECRVFG